MNINNLVKLVEQRFKESGLEQLKKIILQNYFLILPKTTFLLLNN